MHKHNTQHFHDNQLSNRRSVLGSIAVTTLCVFPLEATADFTPGGTLLDRPVSIFFGNAEASPSRRNDNGNVLFNLDNFYKFGAAAQWLQPDSTEFPVTMPFTPSQTRYDALKKYGARLETSKQEIVTIGSAISGIDVPDKDDPVYQLRALGLLANSFLATENTGNTNELLLARWYINEVYLRLGDYKTALDNSDSKEAKKSYECILKAMNSYLTLINRVITNKVGVKFSYL